MQPWRDETWKTAAVKLSPELEQVKNELKGLGRFRAVDRFGKSALESKKYTALQVSGYLERKGWKANLGAIDSAVQTSVDTLTKNGVTLSVSSTYMGSKTVTYVRLA